MILEGFNLILKQTNWRKNVETNFMKIGLEFVASRLGVDYVMLGPVHETMALVCFSYDWVWCNCSRLSVKHHDLSLFGTWMTIIIEIH